MSEQKKNQRQGEGFDISSWKPKTELGRKVKAGEITNIDEILDNGYKILEPEIVDALLPGLEKELLMVGQSKGKFGGGKRSIWHQTQKVSKEGNKMSFGAVAIVGNHNGYIGLGVGKAKETMPAREKAVRKAKLNIIKIRRGDGSWAPGGEIGHSIPYTVKGKSGSVEITLMPAPQGVKLVAPSECQKMLDFAGIKNIYSKTKGKTGTRLNLVKACFEALRQLTKVKVKAEYQEKIVEGRK